jgi:hypothetical protein
MSSNWRQAYTTLTGYVKNNPDIVLGNEIIEIPEHYKTDFYTRFNLVRSSFIEEHFPNMIDQARQISQAFGQAEVELVSRLGLEEIELPPSLRWYVKDPIDALRRVLYDSLFDLLRERVEIQAFEADGIQAIRALDNRLKFNAYQFWVGLSLANLTEPETVHAVDVHISSSTISHAEALNPNEQPIKRPVQATRISLRQEDYIFTPPDMILHSPKLNKYIAIRIEPKSATWTATNASDKNEWLPIDVNAPFLPGMILVNVGDNPWDLALVADAEKVRRPDVIIIAEGLEGWYETDWVDELLLSQEVLQPKSGTFVVSRQVTPGEVINGERLAYKQALTELASNQPQAKTGNITVLNVALDKHKLARIIDALRA